MSLDARPRHVPVCAHARNAAQFRSSAAFTNQQPPPTPFRSIIPSRDAASPDRAPPSQVLRQCSNLDQHAEAPARKGVTAESQAIAYWIRFPGCHIQPDPTDPSWKCDIIRLLDGSNGETGSNAHPHTRIFIISSIGHPRYFAARGDRSANSSCTTCSLRCSIVSPARSAPMT
jgi:hypothetical protein